MTAQVPDYRIVSSSDGKAWKIYQVVPPGLWSPIFRNGNDRFVSREDAEQYVASLKMQLPLTGGKRGS